MQPPNPATWRNTIETQLIKDIAAVTVNGDPQHRLLVTNLCFLHVDAEQLMMTFNQLASHSLRVRPVPLPVWNPAMY
ncbi:MAG: hypothetical protein R2795_18180 [Saprospiraceae bacterium]